MTAHGTLPETRSGLDAASPVSRLVSTSNEFKAWLIDFDGTLYRQLPVRLAMAAELVMTGRQSISVIHQFRREQELLRAAKSPLGDSPYDTQIENTAIALGRPIEQVQSVVREWMEHRPCKWLRLFRRRPLLSEIARFRGQGGKTALVSDYPVSVKFASLRLPSLFDLTVASGEPGGPRTLKPSPEGYLIAAERLGVHPRHCLVIGDRDDADGEAARRGGMSFRLLK